MVQLACVEVPALPLQLLLAAHPEWAGGPTAVVADDRPQALVLYANQPARQAGVKPGLRYGSALALAPGLRASPVAPAALQAGVEALLARCSGFTPGVEAARREPGVFWLDASGLEALYASPRAWAIALREDLLAAGYVAGIAVGFRRFGTYAAAKGLVGREAIAFATPAAEALAAAHVPLARLDLSPRSRMALEKLGIRSVGELLALPAQGLARRFGPEVEALYRFARGDHELPVASTAAPLVVERQLALDYGETNAERLVFVIKPLVDEILVQLGAAGRALVELALQLTLEGAEARFERVRTAEPTLEALAVMELVKLQLAARPCHAPVVALALRAESVQATSEQLQVFATAPKRDLAAAARAFARLRAAFGRDDVIVRASPRDRHAPEGSFAWEPLEAIAWPLPRRDAEPVLIRRLLAKPVALGRAPRSGPDGWLLAGLAAGPVEHLDGPYRLAGGWWRTGIDRDYYFAETRRGDLLWVYYDRERRGWFLHGTID